MLFRPTLPVVSNAKYRECVMILKTWVPVNSDSKKFMGALVHRHKLFMGANCNPLNILGCHGTPGTHANAPSEYNAIVKKF